MRTGQCIESFVGPISQRQCAAKVVERNAVVLVERSRFLVDLDRFFEPTTGMQAIAQVEPRGPVLAIGLRDLTPSNSRLFPSPSPL